MLAMNAQPGARDTYSTFGAPQQVQGGLLRSLLAQRLAGPRGIQSSYGPMMRGPGGLSMPPRAPQQMGPVSGVMANVNPFAFAGPSTMGSSMNMTSQVLRPPPAPNMMMRPTMGFPAPPRPPMFGPMYPRPTLPPMGGPPSNQPFGFPIPPVDPSGALGRNPMMSNPMIPPPVIGPPLGLPPMGPPRPSPLPGPGGTYTPALPAPPPPPMGLPPMAPTPPGGFTPTNLPPPGTPLPTQPAGTGPYLYGSNIPVAGNWDSYQQQLALEQQLKAQLGSALGAASLNPMSPTYSQDLERVLSTFGMTMNPNASTYQPTPAEIEAGKQRWAAELARQQAEWDALPPDQRGHYATGPHPVPGGGYSSGLHWIPTPRPDEYSVMIMGGHV